MSLWAISWLSALANRRQSHGGNAAAPHPVGNMLNMHAVGTLLLVHIQSKMPCLQSNLQITQK